MTIGEYGYKQVQQLLDRVVFELHRSARAPSVNSIHDLRVATRRLTQALRVFRAFVSQAASKEIRKKLEQVMDAAAEVRDRDIALQLCDEAQIDRDAGIRTQLSKERNLAKQKLSRLLRRRARASERWSGLLEENGR
jgi:CHAD domain-containing protein